MAIMDKVLEFFDAQALGAAGNTDSSSVNLGTNEEANMIRLGTGRDWQKGGGKPLYFNVQVNGAAAATSGGSATLTVLLRTSTVTGMTSPDTLFTTPAWAVADMTAGKLIFSAPLPVANMKQFVDCRLTVATATFTAGAIDAWIGDEPQTGQGLDQKI